MVGDLRVQSLERKDGWWHTIVGPDGLVHPEADGFLRTLEPGTSRTYAYLLVDHLRWLERERLSLVAVSLRDLERYMGAVGAKTQGPFGLPWRTGKRPYGNSHLCPWRDALVGVKIRCVAAGDVVVAWRLVEVVE